ncbi:MAG: hypothetical protein DRI56_07755 [Chloroflexota bacterium]|nr:MAG: hypothetical protein DRI56_07755 [Chloroflexota bacterium]
MKIVTVVAYTILLIVMLVITGCYPKFKEVELDNIPFKTLNDDGIVDLNLIIENSSILVSRWLSDTQYSFIAYYGKCQNMPRLEGEFRVLFVEVREQENWKGQPQVIFADVLIHTNSQMADIRIYDVTDSYPNTNTKLPVTDIQFREVISVAIEYLKTLGINDCEVGITQMEETWSVLCKESECDFDIDANSLEVIVEGRD